MPRINSENFKGSNYRLDEPWTPEKMTVVVLADIRDNLVQLRGQTEIANARAGRIETLLTRIDRRLKKIAPIK